MSFSSAPKKEDCIGLRQAPYRARVHADTQVAGVVRVIVVHEILPPEGHGQRCAEALGKLRRARAIVGAPERTAQKDHGAFGSGEDRHGFGDGGVVDPGRGGAAITSARRNRPRRTICPPAGQARPGPGPSAAGEAERAVDVFGKAVRAFHLRHPFHQRAEKRAVIHLLEHAAVAMAKGTCPTKTTMGVASCIATCRPELAFVAPGPRVTNSTPGRPVSFASASAIIAAPPSWRQTTFWMSWS
jgi:hypothetical protein